MTTSNDVNANDSTGQIPVHVPMPATPHLPRLATSMRESTDAGNSSPRADTALCCKNTMDEYYALHQHLEMLFPSGVRTEDACLDGLSGLLSHGEKGSAASSSTSLNPKSNSLEPPAPRTVLDWYCAQKTEFPGFTQLPFPLIYIRSRHRGDIYIWNMETGKPLFVLPTNSLSSSALPSQDTHQSAAPKSHSKVAGTDCKRNVKKSHHKKPPVLPRLKEEDRLNFEQSSDRKQGTTHSVNNTRATLNHAASARTSSSKRHGFSGCGIVMRETVSAPRQKPLDYNFPLRRKPASGRSRYPSVRWGELPHEKSSTHKCLPRLTDTHRSRAMQHSVSKNKRHMTRLQTRLDARTIEVKVKKERSADPQLVRFGSMGRVSAKRTVQRFTTMTRKGPTANRLVQPSFNKIHVKTRETNSKTKLCSAASRKRAATTARAPKVKREPTGDEVDASASATLLRKTNTVSSASGGGFLLPAKRIRQTTPNVTRYR